MNLDWKIEKFEKLFSLITKYCSLRDRIIKRQREEASRVYEIYDLVYMLLSLSEEEREKVRSFIYALKKGDV